MKNMIFILLVVVFACGQHKSQSEKGEVSAQDTLQALKNEVIVLHDEVMPLMEPLYELRMNLQKEVESDSVSGEDVFKMISKVKEAEEAMMNWMRNYEPGYDGGDDASTMGYFLEQKESIDAVARIMKETKAEGEALLSKF